MIFLAKTKKTPLRKCVGCGEMKNKNEMIRILHTPEDEIVLDATGRKNGRGAYLCRSASCLEQALRSKGLERSFKMHISPEIYDALREELARLETE